MGEGLHLDVEDIAWCGADVEQYAGHDGHGETASWLTG